MATKTLKTKHTTGRRSLDRLVMRLRGRITAERKLLSLHDSPFPDAQERKKRMEIQFVIDETERELKGLLCDYDPREMAGLPIGQFHCPKCGGMVIAGLQHNAQAHPTAADSDHGRH